MKEKLIIKVAWMMPRELVKWCAVRLMAHATMSDKFMGNVPELTALEALQLWDK